MKKNKINIKKYLFVILGTASLALGIIGAFVPILPTTPFLLLAAFLYSRSSKKMLYWMLHNRYFGNYLRHYKEGKGIPLRTKIATLILLWGTILYSVIFIVELIYIQILLLIIAVSVSIHLFKLPNYKKNTNNNK